MSPDNPQQPQRKLMLVTHFFNEEMLLPFFIQHHAPLFDHAILIDFDSTDRSVELIKKLAPPSWRVVRSTTGRVFDAQQTDQQVMDWEAQFPEDWHIALTITEFLVHPDPRAYLQKQSPPQGSNRIVRFKSAVIVGNDTEPLQYGVSLPKQRSMHLLQAHGTVWTHTPPVSDEEWWRRFAHTGYHAGQYSYGAGRHSMLDDQGQQLGAAFLDEGVILKYQWSPWPESIGRIAQIGANIPESDIEKGYGTFHEQYNKDMEALLKDREEVMNFSAADLRQLTGLHQGEEVDMRHVSFQAALDPEPLF